MNSHTYTRESTHLLLLNDHNKHLIDPSVVQWCSVVDYLDHDDSKRTLLEFDIAQKRTDLTNEMLDDFYHRDRRNAHARQLKRFPTQLLKEQLMGDGRIKQLSLYGVGGRCELELWPGVTDLCSFYEASGCVVSLVPSVPDLEGSWTTVFSCCDTPLTDHWSKYKVGYTVSYLEAEEMAILLEDILDACF